MQLNTKPKTWIDRIVRCDSKDEKWLLENNLFPSSWELPPSELARIMATGVLLNYFSSPSFVVDFPPPDCFGANQIPFVFFDTTLMTDKTINLSREEMIAIILHELGHKINNNNDEILADRYATECNFGDHLANALEKLHASSRPNFDTDHIIARIAILRQPGQLQRKKSK